MSWKEEGEIFYHIFEQYLYCETSQNSSEDDLIYHVVGDYMHHLLQNGHYLEFDSTEAFLREEALDMLRKKTYGFSSLREFRNAKNILPLSKVPTFNH